MGAKPKHAEEVPKKPSVTLPGTVEKIIPPINPDVWLPYIFTDIEQALEAVA